MRRYEQADNVAFLFQFVQIGPFVAQHHGRFFHLERSIAHVAEKRRLSAVPLRTYRLAVFHGFVDKVVTSVGSEILRAVQAETVECAGKDEMLDTAPRTARFVHTGGKIEHRSVRPVFLAVPEDKSDGIVAHVLHGAQPETYVTVAVDRKLALRFVYVRT